ncbi:MAG: MazG-like family protein [Candidatus Aenigmatarchaeota archaeon]
MDEIEELTKKIVEFRDKRDWKKFHTFKDLAIDISVEAAELLEIFLWKKENELEKVVKEKREEIKEELADVLISSFLLAHDLGLDVYEIVKEKIKKNEIKYPVEKFKGVAKKYSEVV